MSFSTTQYPDGLAVFVDDSSPPITDPIDRFGKVAWNTDDGSNSCPEENETLLFELSGTPCWTYHGRSVSSFGKSVSTAGDVNGDGISDVIVGSPSDDTQFQDMGSARVFLGTAECLARNPVWTEHGIAEWEEFGDAVSTAGDVNGDGYSDILVGAPSYNGNTGRAALYLGSALGIASTPVWNVAGQYHGDRFGASVATAGDFNGDGFDDWVVGAPGGDKAYLYLGGAEGLSSLSAKICSDQAGGDSFGTSVRTAGDVNGDGLADLIVGAPNYSGGYSHVGRAYLYLGRHTDFGQGADWYVTGQQEEACLGFSASTAGDVNGDGYSDVIIGVYGYVENGEVRGKVGIYAGGSGGLATAPAATVVGSEANSRFGLAVSTAGDVNGDGYADVVVGALGHSNGQTEEGAAYVYTGSAGWITASPWIIIESNNTYGWLGRSVGTGGDVDGDGFGDILVGLPGFHGSEDEGEHFGGAAIYRGSAGPPATVCEWSSVGEGVDAYRGRSIASAGDVNGDGYDDFIVGEEAYTNGQTDEGRALLFMGSSSGLAAEPTWQAEGNATEARYGYSVASAGDVNGDGYSDVIIGAYRYPAGGLSQSGKAYVYLGGSGGLGSTPWTAQGDMIDAYFGYSVAGAGDLNGDGFGDVVIGAAAYTNPQVNEGRVYIYLGSTQGLGANPSLTIEMNHSEGRFGSCVAGAGDVNGDGYSDVIAGTWYWSGDGSLTEEGRVDVFLGMAGSVGLHETPTFTRYGESAHAFLGRSVAGAGDVDGDGFGDVIVGAYGKRAYYDREGEVRVYRGVADGIEDDPVWDIFEGSEYAYLGYSVASAGDVNLDGYSDIVVSAAGLTDGEDNEGKVRVYLGGSAGPADTPAWGVEGNEEDLYFGTCVANAGDADGDGFPDLAVSTVDYDGAYQNEGKVFLYMGNGGQGPDRRPQQRKVRGGPLDVLGASDNHSAFYLSALGRSAYGRNRVRLESQIAPTGTELGTVSIGRGSWWLAGAPDGQAGSRVDLSTAAASLGPSTAYHWRLRVASGSPYFPWTPWMAVARAPYTTKLMRTGALVTADVTSGTTEPERVMAEPNPATSFARISFVSKTLGRVRCQVFGTDGRLIRTLADGVMDPGEHTIIWDSRDDAGALSSSGLFLIRIVHDGETECSKITLIR